jgi:hypothetical protein
VEQDRTAIFRLPRRWQIGLFLIVVFGPCAKILLDLDFGMIFSPVPEVITISVWALLWIFVMPRYYTVQLRPSGVKVYSLWWLPWTDVRKVRYRKLFGLRYFLLKRSRGFFPFWIPLYFVGDRDLGDAIIHAAPLGNPFHSVSMPS